MARLSGLLRKALAPPPMRRETALTATERLGSVTHLISSLEYLARQRHRRPGGLNNWEVSRGNVQAWPWPLRKVLDIVSDRRVTNVLHGARVAAALTLLSPVRGRPRLLANLLLSGSSLLLYPRHHYGTDGTDQVSFQVQSAATLARIGERRPQLVDAALSYLAAQAVLSYTTSGWVKLAGNTWRSGEALAGVMRTQTYGDPAAWRFFRRHPHVARVLGAGTLALECLFPVVYLARGALAPPVIGAATVFHLANARLMGLGRFVWAFGSLYPAVIYTSRPAQLHGPAGEVRDVRDGLVPKLCAGLLAGGLGVAAAAQVRRREQVRRRRDHEQLLPVSSGNALAYRRLGPETAGPVIVLEHGLAATAEHWEWVAAGLADRFPTVTYHRAGYGRSRYGASGAYTLDVAVQDLRELVDQVVGQRPVVLAGHSLGGYLALRAAAELPGQVAGLCLLDSSHPAELIRSSRQAQGAPALTNSLALMPTSLRVGLGALLRRPEWVDQLPEQVREVALAQYRDPGMWQAARREWAATRAEFFSFDGTLPRLDVPLLVVTAERTAQVDPVQQELHDELAKLGSSARRHTVAAADHDELLTNSVMAGRVVDIMTTFVDGLDSAGGEREVGG